MPTQEQLRERAQAIIAASEALRRAKAQERAQVVKEWLQIAIGALLGLAIVIGLSQLVTV